MSVIDVWTCHLCGSNSLMASCPEQCPLCPHKRCRSCTIGRSSSLTEEVLPSCDEAVSSFAKGTEQFHPSTPGHSSYHNINSSHNKQRPSDNVRYKPAAIKYRGSRRIDIKSSLAGFWKRKTTSKTQNLEVDSPEVHGPKNQLPSSAKQEQRQYHTLENISSLPPAIRDNIATKPGSVSAQRHVRRDDIGIVEDKEATSQSPMADVYSTKITVVDNIQHIRNPRSQISGNGPVRIGEALNEFILYLPSLSFGSTLSSSGPVEELESASEELAKLFLEDELLKPLYAKAMEKVKTDRLEKNFGRLLKTFAMDLQREANGVLEASAARFLKARAKYTAYCMAKHLDPSRKADSKMIHELIIESHARQEKVELYLQRQVQHVNSEEAPSLNEAKYPDTMSYKSESGLYAGKAQSELLDRSHMKDFNDVKVFLSTSTALVNLRASLRQLLFQEQGGNQKPAQPTNPVHLPLDSSVKPNMGPLILTDTESEESNEGEIMEPAIPAEVHPFFAPFRMLLRGFKMAAEFLELLEKPLDSRFRRIRWTCVCGTRLYDDFRELAPGALDELERFLNNNDEMEQL